MQRIVVSKFVGNMVVAREGNLTLDSIPQRRNSLNVFIKRNSKAIDLALILHEQEGIIS